MAGSKIRMLLPFVINDFQIKQTNFHVISHASPPKPAGRRPDELWPLASELPVAIDDDNVYGLSGGKSTSS